MTVNFEYENQLNTLHPGAWATEKYSIMAEVNNGVVKITSVKGKVRSLLSDGEYETLPVPVFGNSREANEFVALFSELALKAAQDEIKRQENEKNERANQTA